MVIIIYWGRISFLFLLKQIIRLIYLNHSSVLLNCLFTQDDYLYNIFVLVHTIFAPGFIQFTEPRIPNQF